MRIFPKILVVGRRSLQQDRGCNSSSVGCGVVPDAILEIKMRWVYVSLVSRLLDLAMPNKGQGRVGVFFSQR